MTISEEFISADEGLVGIRAKFKLMTMSSQTGSKTESIVTDSSHRRWSLLDDTNIDYGYFGQTRGAGISEATKETAFYLTTAINYTNGPAHMGHAYEATTSDALSRYARLKGEGPVYFLTGSDEHGQKIANTAAAEGKEPIEICDKVCMTQSNGIRCCRHVSQQV